MRLHMPRKCSSIVLHVTSFPHALDCFYFQTSETKTKTKLKQKASQLLCFSLPMENKAYLNMEDKRVQKAMRLPAKVLQTVKMPMKVIF